MKQYLIKWRFIFLPLFVLTGCNNHPPSEKFGDFTLTNIVLNGDVQQIFKSSSGLAIVPSRNDVVICFGTNGVLNVVFDQKSLAPISTLFEVSELGSRPSQVVADFNADGVPELRQIKGDNKKQLFYMGKWHETQEEGSNYSIELDGARLNLFFDGQKWSLLTNR